MTKRRYTTLDVIVAGVLAWLLVLMIHTGNPYDPGRLIDLLYGLYMAVIVTGFALALIAVLIVVGRFVKRTLENEGDE